MHLPSLPRRVPMAVWSLVLAAGLLPATVSFAAQPLSAPLAPAPSTLAMQAASSQPPPLRLAEGFGVEPLARMSEARIGALDRLEALAAHNRAGILPVQVGFERPLPVPRSLRLDAIAGEAAGVHAGGVFARGTPSTTVWGASVWVEGAYRLRLHIGDVRLPVDTRMWVYSQDGEAVGPFGTELVHDGELLTPSVAGPIVHLEVELPRQALADGTDYGFRLDRVAEIVRLGPSGEPLLGRAAPVTSRSHDDCLVDATCVDTGTFPEIDRVGAAIAHLRFPQEEGIFICTGGLLNTVPAEGGGSAPEPPLLTANHCLSTESSAAGLEAFWDFSTPGCNGTPPSLDDLPRTNGANLLVTGPESDFTLLRVSLPPERVLLGWNAEPSATAPGSIVHRVSHPVAHGALFAQTHARYEILASGDSRFQACKTDDPNQDIQDTSRFLHLQPLQGGTFGGSSGAPSMLGNGQVVGQLFGGCPGADGCDPVNNDIDGAFQTTFDRISSYLVAGGGAPPTSTPIGDSWLTTPEQPGFEFQVQITQANGSPFAGSMEPNCIAESLCVSGALAGRPELFVKIIGPRPNGFLWVQISRFTPSQVEVWVRQVASGDINYYRLEAIGPGSDDLSGLQDRRAFTP